MTYLGNLFLLAAAGVVAGLLGGVYGKPPPQGGDAAVGYPWGVLILNTVLLGLLTVVYGIIAARGALPWVSPRKGVQALVVLACLLACVISSALGGLFKYENGPVPALMRFLAQFLPALIPVLLVLVAAVLLNDALRVRVPLVVQQAASVTVALLGLLGVAAGLQTWFLDAQARAVGRLRDAAQFEDRNHRRMLEEIEQIDVSRELFRLLVFTGDNHHPDIRERARARLKSRPDWQEQLRRGLEGEEAAGIFQFLAYCPVDDPAQFIEPVRLGIRTQAADIRRTIRRASHPSHLYPGQFSYEVERVLRTVDRFAAHGGDYRAEVRELRAALREKSEFPKPEFACAAMLDRWLQAHP